MQKVLLFGTPNGGKCLSASNWYESIQMSRNPASEGHNPGVTWWGHFCNLGMIQFFSSSSFWHTQKLQNCVWEGVTIIPSEWMRKQQKLLLCWPFPIKTVPAHCLLRARTVERGKKLTHYPFTHLSACKMLFADKLQKMIPYWISFFLPVWKGKAELPRYLVSPYTETQKETQEGAIFVACLQTKFCRTCRSSAVSGRRKFQPPPSKLCHFHHSRLFPTPFPSLILPIGYWIGTLQPRWGNYGGLKTTISGLLERKKGESEILDFIQLL